LFGECVAEQVASAAAAAILVPRDITAHGAAAAAELCRSAFGFIVDSSHLDNGLAAIAIGGETP
jgi:hypothetical protein